jgi:uncharacterized protein YraI
VLDIRGQGSFDGEVVAHVKKGESVTVSEEITLSRVRPGEPRQWSRIDMPTNAAVWVDADFINPETKTVRVKKLNMRGGPGENYSVVGRLEQGTVITTVLGKKAGWLKIEALTNAFGFVASEYLDKQAAAAPAPMAVVAPTPVTPPTPPPAPEPVVVNVPPETVSTPAKPAETAPPAPVAPAPTPASEADQELAALHRAAAPEPALAAPAPAPAPAQPENAVQGPPRIVTVEGFVHRAYNIQAPAGYELHDIKTGDLIDYLQPPPGLKKFKTFVGTRVRITGSEFLDPAWKRTPVLHIETVDLMP